MQRIVIDLLLGLSLTTLLFVSSASADVNFTQCLADFMTGKYGLDGAVDGNGNAVISLNQTEGLLYRQCVSICGSGHQTNSWSQISTSLTSWLFPWLVLVAQLPFQTKGQGNDVLSAFLVVGSPVIAMYSLLVTLSNSRWIYRKCRELEIIERYDGDREHMLQVAYVLSMCQQVPLEIKDPKLLACSIALQRNRAWWGELADRLRDSARILPESLWPQIFLVIGTYILTVIDAFRSLGGMLYLNIFLMLLDQPTAFGLAIGMAWAWTFSLVLGWYTVGTQMTRGCIKDTLSRANKHLEVPRYLGQGADDQAENRKELKRVNSLALRHGPLAHREGTPQGRADRLWGTFTIAGDEESPGPVYNYARIYTWQRIAVIVIDAHCKPRLAQGDVPGSSDELLRCCHFNPADVQEQIHPFSRQPRTQTIEMDEGRRPRQLPQPQQQVDVALPPPKFKPTDIHGGALSMFSLAMLFHFCTSLPPFLIDFLTPTVGLGCHSGSYLLYFGISFAAAWFLVGSAWLSKRWIWLRDQRRSDQRPRTRLSNFSFHMLAFFAVLFRGIGKLLAYLNSIWILIYCIFVFSGLYEQCYCQAAGIQRGDNGWITFLTAPQLVDQVRGIWIGTLVGNMVVMTATSFLLWWLPQDYRSASRWPRSD
jgi:hypothetical protein